ncbi:MAG: hypothetical protein AAF529_04720 [Pseudomonadota bacterium]
MRLLYTNLMGLRHVTRAASAVFALIFTANLQAGTASVGDFALLDHTGRHHQLSYYSDQKAVVIGSRVSDAESAAVAALKSQIGADQLVWLMLDAQNDRTALDGSESSLPVLVDESQLVTEALGFTHAGQVAIVDPKNLSLLYQGSVDGASAALQAVLSGASVQVSDKGAGGSPLRFAARAEHAGQGISYTKDIAPILTENCVSCHYEGGIGPWAMNSHIMIQGFAPMIREVVMTKRLPPGQFDTHVSHNIVDASGLTTAEQQKLIHWIDAGAPKDGDVDPLAELKIAKTKFTLGEPDLIYKIPAQKIPATGVVDYRYVPVELNLDKDVWISAMEFVPGDRQVLHHIIAYLSSPADKSRRGRDGGADQGENLAGFAPGRQPDQFFDNSGRLIRAGSNLLLQMHYTTSGKETVDESEIGIYLHDKPPEHVMSGGVAGQRRFLVPPGAKEHELRGEQLIEQDAYLYQMTPHMHYRGKHMSYTAEYPDGTSELLLSVPKYDFNWQFSYLLEEPAFLPAGTKLIAHGAMDNSAQNPSNPDPSKPVH